MTLPIHAELKSARQKLKLTPTAEALLMKHERPLRLSRQEIVERLIRTATLDELEPPEGAKVQWNGVTTYDETKDCRWAISITPTAQQTVRELAAAKNIGISEVVERLIRNCDINRVRDYDPAD